MGNVSPGSTVVSLFKVVVHFDNIQQFEGNNFDPGTLVLLDTHSVTDSFSQRFEGAFCYLRYVIGRILFRRAKKLGQLILRCLFDRKGRIFILDIPPAKRFAIALLARKRFILDADTPVISLGTQVIHAVQCCAIPVQVMYLKS